MAPEILSSCSKPSVPHFHSTVLSSPFTSHYTLSVMPHCRLHLVSHSFSHIYNANLFLYYPQLRQRSPESRGDRYMLFTFEDPPLHIKVRWEEHSTQTGIVHDIFSLSLFSDILSLNSV